MLRDALSARAQLASGVFHEELSAARRDTEVARFRADDGPSMLVSTEAGGEGRNFEFCHRSCCSTCRGSRRPSSSASGGWIASAVASPVEIVYFRPPSGHRCRRRAAVRAARAVPRADGRHRAAARAISNAHSRTIALEPERVAVRRADREARRRSAGGAHAHPRGGVSATASRSVPSRAGIRDPRSRAARTSTR